MSAPATRHQRLIDGFKAVTLRNDAVELTVVPALGARIISCRAVGGTREWIWSPQQPRGLFACPRETPFDDSPLAGVDECIPSVLPSTYGPLTIADHGDVWFREWTEQNATAAEITTTVTLDTLPLTFRRRVTLDGSRIRFDYTLTNNSAGPVPYLWAQHPLFTLEPTDRIELAGKSDIFITETKNSVIAAGERGPWPSPRPGIQLERVELGFTKPAPHRDSFLKGFLETKSAPKISLVDPVRRERLTLCVDPRETCAWGYWASQGGWNGHIHLALEPTNAIANGLHEITPGPQAHTLAPNEVRHWHVEWRAAIAGA